jgi:hypothetical protein
MKDEGEDKILRKADFAPSPLLATSAKDAKAKGKTKNRNSGVRVGTGVAGKAQLVTLRLVLVPRPGACGVVEADGVSGRWDVPGSRLQAALSSNSGFVSSALSARTCNGAKRLPSRRCGQAIASKRTASQIEYEYEYAERQTPNAKR